MAYSIPPNSSSSFTPPSAASDRENELLEQSQHISNELILERQIRVANAAKKALEEDGGRFTIRLKIPSGSKVTNPLSGEEMEEFKEGEYETKTYHFHKIAANDWTLYRTKLAELQNETAKPLDKVDNSKVADLNNRIYEFLAIKYLGMKHDDYIRAEWDDVRLAVDACNSITEWQSQEVVVEAPDMVRLVKNNKLDVPAAKKHQRVLQQQQQQQEEEEEGEEEEQTREVTRVDAWRPSSSSNKSKDGGSSSSSSSSSSSKKKLYDYEY